VDPLEDDALHELDALRREVSELRASRRRLAVSAETERRAIERALHEGVQQLLVALAANLELAAASMDPDPGRAKELLAEIGEDARKALGEARNLAERIYPPLLEAGGLVPALRAAAATAAVKTRIDVEKGTTVPSAVAGAVYFCCVDVLERAASGTPVAISVRNEDGALAFELVAECDVEAERLPLRDRVEALGGRVTIQQGPGRRISVAGSLPIS
jgi:signal transduction histidine kinase